MTSDVPVSATLQREADEYWSRGYTVVKNLYSEEDLAAWRGECERLWALPGVLDDLNLRSEFRRNVSGDWVVDRLDPVLDMSGVLLDAVFAPGLLAALRAILGGDATLLKCKLIRKDPGTGGYAQHQDFLYWRWLDMPPDALCSVAIPLYTSNAESGGIEFFPGYHRDLLPGACGNPDADFDISCVDVSTGEVPTLEPGDALVFHSLAPHRSAPNRSNRQRTLLLPSFAVSGPADAYGTYYKREMIRRCAEFVGFERFESSLQAIADRQVLASSVQLPKTRS
jgi:ectoine hydroxylase-related dioxygenase (phytanoyl-CoA dioxygenase family)